MICHGVGEVCADIFQAQDIGDELGEIVGVRGNLLGALCELIVANVLSDEFLLVSGGTRARARRNHNCVPFAVKDGFEGSNVVASDLGGIFEVAGVGMHLAAADLAFREDDFMAQSFKQRDCCLRGLGEHDVCQAS